jgi:ATP-dependent DNA helicase RecQ
VRLVVHYKLPADIESYFQQAGRAGRDGEPAYCVLLYKDTKAKHYRDESIHEWLRQKTQPNYDNVRRLFDSLSRQQTTTLLVDPENIVDELELEEEDDVKRLVHILENAGYLERHEDVPISGRLALRGTRAEVVQRATACGADAALLDRLAQGKGGVEHESTEVDLRQLSQQLGVTLEQLNAAIREYQRHDLIFFSIRAVAFKIVLTPKMQSALQLDEAELNRSEERAQRKLREMLDYVHLRRGQCRRRYLLRYFGEDMPRDNCGGCDNCASADALGLPWANVAAPNVITAADAYDPGLYLLNAIHDFGARYGLDWIRRMLRGDTKRMVNGQMQYLPRELRASSYFQRLKFLSDQKIKRATALLFEQGYIERFEREVEGFDHPLPFTRLTAKGMEARERMEALELPLDAKSFDKP